MDNIRNNNLNNTTELWSKLVTDIKQIGNYDNLKDLPTIDKKDIYDLTIEEIDEKLVTSKDHLKLVNGQNVLILKIMNDLSKLKEELTTAKSDNKLTIKGKQYWLSKYSVEKEIEVGDEVAYKPKKSLDNEWFHCEIIKISNDGIKFEVRDPEPDEFGNKGKIFKCNWKDILIIPKKIGNKLANFPVGSKVLARYPETTTFYPAIVVGYKRDGTCKLKFDGEEEIDKQTEIPRRFVLPYPTISAFPTKN